MAKPIPGACGPPSDSDKSVIAAAAENRVLRAQGAVSKLECRARVIVEAAHQAIVEREGNADGVQNRLHLLEMLAATLIQKLADARQLLDDRLVFGNFAVKHAQRIGHRAALAVGAHLEPPARVPCARASL